MKFRLAFFLVALFTICAITDCTAQYGTGGRYGGPSERDKERWRIAGILAYKKAKDNGENMKKWWKGEGTLGLIFAPLPSYTLRSRYETTSGSSVPSYDTVKTGTSRHMFSFQGNSSVDHLLVRTSPSSIISFSAGLQADFLRYQFLNYDTSATVNGKAGVLWYVRAGAPLTLDYKWGSDVDFDPNIKGCFSIGAGIMPYYSISVLNLQQTQGFFHVAPYVYASVGFYAWSCWKIRAAYIPGNAQIFDGSTSNNGGVISTLSASTTGGGTFTIGIGVMQHSHDWGSAHGERTGWGLFGGGHTHGRGWNGDETAHMRMF